MTETLSELPTLFPTLYTRYFNTDISQLHFRFPLENSVLHECRFAFIKKSRQHSTPTNSLELESTRFVGVPSFFASF